MEYGIYEYFYGVVGAYETNLEPLICLQKRFLKPILFKNKKLASKPLYKQLRLFPLQYIFVYKVLTLFYATNGDLPQLENMQIKAQILSLHSVTKTKQHIVF